MIILVVGGQNSGKSEFAEGLVVKSGADRRYYLATMKVCDDAGEERIRRHRKQREGKGFTTIEMQYGIDRAAEMMDEPAESVVLLECMANLVGNELYDNPERDWNIDGEPYKLFADTVVGDVIKLAGQVKELIVVTNEYRAGEDYNPNTDKGTLMYIELLDLVNERLKRLADNVYMMNPDTMTF